ncbi:unnamed protein product [Oppiella nova]|uniref:histone acetyltransferase n=1 Tax=Oppiella nova TaxID=334625 RepID=A0A7R9QKZ9_9ACAR|nr:unnamed protein product [Oppiella nova]CAG2168064.1 unnamed protein product [Oppiella nova]
MRPPIDSPDTGLPPARPIRRGVAGLAPRPTLYMQQTIEIARLAGLDLDTPPQEEYPASMQTYEGSSSAQPIGRVQTLVHSSGCTVGLCSYPLCDQMKDVVRHYQSCQFKSLWPKPASVPHCSVCDQLMDLCTYHAKNCYHIQCPVPHCLDIRRRLRQRQDLRLAKKRVLRMLVEDLMRSPEPGDQLSDLSSPGMEFKIQRPVPRHLSHGFSSVAKSLKF